VPLLHGVTPAFFDKLMESTDWNMLLPNQYVVKQGQIGDKMYMLCYGQAVTELDGFLIGNELSPGDCIGKPNFFGISTEYNVSVLTSMVCHFRSVTPKVLEKLLDHNPAECERFEQIKYQVKREALDKAREQQEQVSQEKLRRREQGAFRSHVSSVRNQRGVKPIDMTPAQLELVDAVMSRRKDDLETIAGEPSRKSMDMRSSSFASARVSSSSSRSNSAREDSGTTRDWVSLRNKWKNLVQRPNARSQPLNLQTPSTSPRVSARPGSVLVKRIHERKSVLNTPSMGGMLGSPKLGASPLGGSPSAATRRVSVWQEAERDSDTDSEHEEARPEKGEKTSVSRKRRKSFANADMAATGVVGGGGGTPRELSLGKGKQGAPKSRAAKAKARASTGSLFTKPASMQEARLRKPSMSPTNAQKGVANPQPTSTRQGSKQSQQAEQADAPSSESDSESSESSLTSGSSSSDGGADQNSSGCLKVLITDMGVGGTSPNNNLSAVAEEGSPSHSHGSGTLLGGKTIEQIFYAKMNELVSKRPLSKVERIEAAISMHNDARQRALARGKVLRAMRTGMPIILTEGDDTLEDLQDWLMPDDSPTSSQGGDTPDEAEDAATGALAVMDGLATAGVPEEALRSKFRQLVGFQKRQCPAKSAFS